MPGRSDARPEASHLNVASGHHAEAKLPVAVALSALVVILDLRDDIQRRAPAPRS